MARWAIALSTLFAEQCQRIVGHDLRDPTEAILPARIESDAKQRCVSNDCRAGIGIHGSTLRRSKTSKNGGGSVAAIKSPFLWVAYACGVRLPFRISRDNRIAFDPASRTPIASLGRHFLPGMATALAVRTELDFGRLGTGCVRQSLGKNCRESKFAAPPRLPQSQSRSIHGGHHSARTARPVRVRHLFIHRRLGDEAEVDRG